MVILQLGIIMQTFNLFCQLLKLNPFNSLIFLSFFLFTLNMISSDCSFMAKDVNLCRNIGQDVSSISSHIFSLNCERPVQKKSAFTTYSLSNKSLDRGHKLQTPLSLKSEF